jgi:L-seryl-tRNA(Ser) seleniumtransferase
MSELYRLLPAMDKLLEALRAEPELAGAPRPLLRDLAQGALDRIRADIREADVTAEDLAWERLFPRIRRRVIQGARPHFRRVLNATGVVIHTNLGRSILAESAVEAVARACRHYSNLEFDLGAGARGSRYSHVEDLLRRVTGAEAGLVVNNNASAVLLVLDTLAKGRESIVSRGQLVEIGGSFRIPDVMRRSGSTLVEVGATNRTHPRDYEDAITEQTGLLMKVHSSNFRIVGFTREVSPEELVDIGRRHAIPVYEDLGSGNFHDFAAMGFDFEPTVQEAVASGIDVISFSGDKVLGGPQAGVIVGRREYIDLIKKNPLNRALRIDKMTLAALEETLRLYLDPERARREIPTLAMITAEPAELKRKAQTLARTLRSKLGEHFTIGLAPGVSRVGGGSFPERDLPTTLVVLDPKAGAPSISAVKEALLATDPPLVGRIEEDRLHLDPRTLAREEFRLVADALAQALHALGTDG